MKFSPSLIKISILWTVGARWCFNLLGIISTLILARLLTPEDFGLIAMVAVVVAFLDLFADQGFETYLITVKHVTRAEYETIWTIKFLVYLFLGGVLVANRTIIAGFYSDPRLELIVISLAIPFILDGLQNVRLAGFQRRQNYRPFFFIQVVPKIASFGVTITLAFVLRNYWALIFGVITNSLVRLALGFYLRPWQPRLSFKKIRDIFNYTRWLFGNNFLNFFLFKGVELSIGKVLGAKELGFFGLARELADMPNQLLFAPMNRALLSGYATAKNIPDELTKLVKFFLSIIAMASIPAGIGMMMVTQQLVPVLLGDQWLPLIPVLELLALLLPLTAIGGALGYVYLATDRPMYVTGLLSFQVALVGVSLYLFLPKYGLVGPAMALLVAASIGLIANQYVACRLYGWNWFKDIAPCFVLPLIASLVMAYCLASYPGLTDPSLIALIASISIGIISYGILMVVLMHFTSINSQVNEKVFSLVKEKIDFVKAAM